MKIQSYSLILLIIVVLLGSCDPAEKYKAELSSLDGAIARLDSIENAYGDLPLDTLSRLYKKVKADMELLQDNYQGDMPLEVGVRFSRYRDIPNNIKNLGETTRKFSQAIATSKSQISGLKDAILSGANRDAKGNSINESYIKKNVDTETKVVDELVEQMTKFDNKAGKSFTDYEQYYPEVKGILDSLKTTLTEE